mgnify:CR=1 FL=1
MNYKPLPSGLIIKDSGIEGQGIFTTRDLRVGCNLGESHYRIDTSGMSSINHEENENLFIRTPLGGFINHSEYYSSRKHKSWRRINFKIYYVCSKKQTYC